jgi:formamidopyrimidine-DNA glycosylase
MLAGQASSILRRLPELPEVESVRSDLESAMVRARFDEVIVRRPNLRTRFPKRFRERLLGTGVLAVRRRAKYLLVPLSSDDTLVMHLGMSGWFTISSRATSTPDPHDHVVFRMSSGAIVTFNDPRRFGFMDLVPASKLETYPSLRRLGPEPLSSDFEAVTLARACKGKKAPLKAALLDQRVVAGLGNIYVCEALHVAQLSPRRRASTIASRSGMPRESATRLVDAIKLVLTEAIERQRTPERYDNRRFRVYDREGEACPRPGCTGKIVRRVQAGRSTFFCPVCQR